MDQTVKVAVVRHDDRRQAVTRALELIRDDVAACVANEVLIKPNLVSHERQLASTHADTLSATLDALFAAGATRAIVAEGATDASAGFERFGFLSVVSGRPVRFFDINREETRWQSLELSAVDGEPLEARLSRTIIDSSCRVSLALMKTHVTSIVTMGLKNMLSSIHPDDRVMMHGRAGRGNGYHGWRAHVVDFLKRDDALVRAITQAAGRVRNFRNSIRTAHATGDTFLSLTRNELGFLRTVAAMNRNLVALARETMPHLSVVDGFVGMHREGPRHGAPLPLGVVVAGTDAVAVDAVAATVMGFEAREIGYLSHAHAAGLGEIDVDSIRVVGDPIAQVRKHFVPHSNHFVQRHWRRLGTKTGQGPHFAFDRSQRVVP